MTDEYEPILLGSHDLLNAYWPHVQPLLEKCVSRATHGEYTIKDLRDLAYAGRIYIFALVNDKHDPTVERKCQLAVALETINYPRLPALNILAVGGSGLSMAHKKYWKMLCGWAYMSGVRAIDGWVGPGMKRTSEALGFKAVYTHMRYDLTESNNV